MTSCIPAKSGARCSTTDWGRDGHYALQCVNGRWQRRLTYAQVAQAFIALSRPAVGQLPNTADPSVLVDGGLTYVYATTTNLRVPVRVIPDVDHIDAGSEQILDAMPQTPTWAATPEIWAPDVAKLGGRYVMFFAAHRQSPPDPSNDECVGRAFSSSPTGPFIPDASPITCGNDGIHGALDPSVFVAPGGSAYLLVAMGGTTTNIWSIPIDGNGTPTGPAVALATRDQPWEHVFLENPSMIWDGSAYVLAYSDGNWQQESYDTGISRCKTPTGPCTDRPDGPWLQSLGDRWGPGGLSFFVGADGQARVAFESYAAGQLGTIGMLSTTIDRFYTDPWPRLG
jgi:beta-xylosidase